MRSTQLSESLNATLKRYLQVDHNIVQFFTHFNRIVVDKRYEEVKAIYNYRQQLPRMKSKKSPILNQVANLYTPPIFDLFHNELDMSLSCQVKQCHELEGEVRYVIDSYGDDREYIVEGNMEVDELGGDKICQKIHCTCQKFENIGILCGHAIKALDRMNVMEIPERDLCPRMVKLATQASVYKSAYQLVDEGIKELCTKVNKMMDVGIPYWPQLMNYGYNLFKLDDTNIACSSSYPQSTPLSSQISFNSQTSQGMPFDEGELNPNGGEPFLDNETF
ncbi:hypothetical protein ACSBR2_035180 [Camellia fascicularis]